MVASASMVISDQQFGSSFHYLIRQSIYIALGIGLAYAITKLPLNFWEKISIRLLFLSLFLLILVLIPGIGRAVNGSRRWLSLGFFHVQVSEFIKLPMILYLASYLHRYQEQGS